MQLGEYNLFQIYGLYLQTLPEMNWFHLWFLVDLFIFSMITIPLFYTRGSGGKSLIGRISNYFNNPWALLLLLVVSITLVNILVYPDGYWGYRNGGWNIVTYLFFFIFGYLIFANPRIIEMVRKLRWISLGIGIIAGVCLFVIFLDEMADTTQYFGSPGFILGSFTQSLTAWGWLLAILGFGSQHLNRNNRFLNYANEAVLPFYILHQTVIITIGFYVVQWNIGIGLKYLIISTTSFIAIMLIYELLVRRINVLRFLFGMRLNKSHPVSVSGNKS